MTNNTLVINLSNQVAVVTGGDRGIGKGIVGQLARSGALIYIACRNVEQAQEVAGAHPDATIKVVKLDVTDQASVDVMVQTVISEQGKIDILVNNAGVVGAPGWEKREEETAEDWELNYAVNLRGLARVTDAVVPHMQKQKNGKIINISSTAGRGGNKGHIPSSYGATKAAVINLTQTQALAFASDNIMVNCICPGIIWTPMWNAVASRLGTFSSDAKGMDAKAVYDKQVSERIPLGREQTAEDIGSVVAFLASDLAQNITGQSINVNGGIRMN